MKREKFRYLPHTADIAFFSYGVDKKEAIENAALALLNIMLDLKRINESKSKVKELKIREKASSIEDLIWFILQDILSNIDARALKAYSFRIDALRESKSGARLTGSIMHKDIKDDLSLLEVKAVTPHNLTISKNRKRYRIHVLVDV